MREGPVVYLAKETLCCMGCKYLEAIIFRSGIEPQWQFNCMHPLKDPHTNGFIGFYEYSETPFWCPFTKTGKKLKNETPKI